MFFVEGISSEEWQNYDIEFGYYEGDERKLLMNNKNKEEEENE